MLKTEDLKTAFLKDSNHAFMCWGPQEMEVVVGSFSYIEFFTRIIPN